MCVGGCECVVCVCVCVLFTKLAGQRRNRGWEVVEERTSRMHKGDNCLQNLLLEDLKGREEGHSEK